MTKRRHERDEVLAIIEERGIRAAVEAAIDVANDKKAPPAARATASGLLLRAGAVGGFARNYTPEGAGKEVHEMTPEERSALLRSLRSEAPDSDGGAFD